MKALTPKEAAYLVADPKVDSNGVSNDVVQAPASKRDHTTQFQEMTAAQWDLYDAETQLQKYREMEYMRKMLIDEADKLAVDSDLIDGEITKVKKQTKDQSEELSKLKDQMAKKAKADKEKAAATTAPVESAEAKK